MNLFRNVLDNMIPISLFNRGQAGKIFEEVKKSGAKIVIKNNEPECILMSPAEYKEMLERFEDERDYAIAVERMKNFDEKKLIPAEKVYADLGILQEDVDAVPEEEIEFE